MPIDELVEKLARLQADYDTLLAAAQEVAEVAHLRGEGHLNPCDDPISWTSRWNEALQNLAELVS